MEVWWLHLTLTVPAAKNVWTYEKRTLTDHEFEVEWATDPAVDNVASDSPTALTAGTVTPNFPSGATKVRAILLPIIKVCSLAANVHHIGFKIQYEKGVIGTWTDLKDFTANPPLALGPVDGAVDSWSHPIDVTEIVEDGAEIQFRFVVDSDNAGSVNYTTSFVLVLVYRMA